MESKYKVIFYVLFSDIEETCLVLIKNPDKLSISNLLNASEKVNVFVEDKLYGLGRVTLGDNSLFSEGDEKEKLTIVYVQLYNIEDHRKDVLTFTGFIDAANTHYAFELNKINKNIRKKPAIQVQ